MLTRAQLEEISRFNRLPLHILEQDYIQAVFLSRLSVRHEALNLLFKGGTCIRLAYGLDRYSEDLDFTLISAKPETPINVPDTFRRCASDLSLLGVESKVDKAKEDGRSFTARLRYNGPLYDGTERSAGSIRLEVSKRKDQYLEPAWAVIAPRYADLNPFRLNCMAEEEILAEKVRAMVQRAKARDFYDVWFLLKKGVPLDKSLVLKKCRALDIEFKVPKGGFTIPEPEWTQDLANLLPTPVGYGPVLKELNAAIRRTFR